MRGRTRVITAMSSPFPSQNVLYTSFASSAFLARPRTTASAQGTPPTKPLWTTWSAIDNVKDKAEKVSKEAAREYEKASSVAQKKAGGIELYSAKYYAACTFGGIIACVSARFPRTLQPLTP